MSSIQEFGPNEGGSWEEIELFKFVWPLKTAIVLSSNGGTNSPIFRRRPDDYISWYISSRCDGEYIDFFLNAREFKLDALKKLEISSRIFYIGTASSARKPILWNYSSLEGEIHSKQYFMTYIPKDKFKNEIISKLKFHVSITYHPNPEYKSASTIRFKNQIEFLERILTEQKFTDMKIIVQEKEFSLHKAIMSARCSYFENVFNYGTVETRSNSIVVEDFDAKIIENMIRFIYLGNLPTNLTENRTGKEQDVYLEETLELFRAADKYGIEDLKIACEDNLVALDFRGKPLRVLELVSKYWSSSSIKARVMDHVRENQDQLFSTEEWVEFAENNPDIVLEI